MALVTTIETGSKEGRGVHRTTRCVSTVVEDSGQRYLQLDTYGSDERKHPEKISQSIQFDRAAAAQLLALIRTTFPDLA